MPAIQIERLNEQIRSLMNPNLPPQAFLESLQSFLDAHANRAYRPGLEVQHLNPINSYHLAPVIKQQLHLHLVQFARTNPDLALQYSDLIWKQSYIEMKQLAAIFIGSLPESYSKSVFEKIEDWGINENDSLIRRTLFDLGTNSIRNNNVNDWINYIKNWLESGNNSKITAGLIAIQVLIKDNNFENIPTIFNMVHPLFDNQNDPVVNALVIVIKFLYHRTPKETFYFLRSFLLSEPTQKRNRFVRRCFTFLSSNHQQTLRKLMEN
jgi:hypothetical protein